MSHHLSIRPLLFLLPLVAFTGCVSDMDLGNGRVLNLAKVETRSAFGVNDSRSRLRDCVKARDEADVLSYVYTDCRWVDPEWSASSSPGQGGQIAAGALTGLGLGVAGAMINSGASSASSSVSSLTTAITHGGKGSR